MNVFISKEIQRQSDYLPDEAASQNVSCHYQTHLPLHSTHSIEPVTRTQTPHHIWSYDLMALYNTHNPFNGPFSRTTRGWAGTRKEKPIWILLKQETVIGSGISWAICKSAPRSRQITMPAPHHSVFYRPDALPAAQPTASKHLRQCSTNSKII